MNPRQTITLMLSVGMLLIGALSLTPRILKSSAEAYALAARSISSSSNGDPSPPSSSARESMKAVVSC
ncbi:MAG: hypothetical protein WKF84_08670 [Pyrinomonadaceae bacterium]